MASNIAVKKTALSSMKGNELSCVAAAVAFMFVCVTGILLLGVVTTCLSNVAGLIFAAVFLVAIIFPVFLGVLRFFRRVQWGECDSPLSVLYYFSSREKYKSAVTLSINLWARAVIGYIVLNIPAFTIKTITSHKLYELLKMPTPVWASSLWPVFNFLQFCAAVLLFIYMLKFYLAPFLFVSTDKTAEESVFLSRTISRRTASDFFWLILSLAGWIILSLLFVPLVFTLPYFVMCYVVHCRFAVAQYNKVVESMKFSPPSFSADSGI